MPGLHRGLPLPRHRVRRGPRARAEMHVLLRPPPERPDARVRDVVSDPIEPVRPLGRNAPARRGAGRAAPRPGHVRGARLRGQGVWRAAHAVPADGQAGSVPVAERGERRRPPPQQPCGLSRLARDGVAGYCRRAGGVPRPTRGSGQRGIDTMPEHFVAPPDWGWYILGYFFFGGIAGGAYALGTMLRLWGEPRDASAARLAFLISFIVLLICPILLTFDLGRPFRFWHMLIDARTGTLSFKYWSPMSVGAWALMAFGVFAAGSFAVGRPFMILGSALGLFIAGYTGVLLSVSNQPVWSDTWALGGLFLASALSSAAAAIAFIALRRGGDAQVSTPKLFAADRYFIILELVLLVVFFLTLGAAASKVLGAWLLLWLIVLSGTVLPLVLHLRPTLAQGRSPLLAPGLVLIGNIALRAVIIFGAQA